MVAGTLLINCDRPIAVSHRPPGGELADAAQQLMQRRQLDQQVNINKHHHKDQQQGPSQR
ncbi:Uncharacterised protein [Raoultella terrigena]|uniref:Uncharacterized protein n=1 Tax=Raoultella terrigena TaxID=577 RepID=A0A3P8JP91_RAOTE|nr:Uncharacterised protein [Raoultella terrigena]